MNKEKYTAHEQYKEESDFLRGRISSFLQDPLASHFPAAEEFLLKFHGVTQQDDRDVRQLRKKAGKDRDWSFMVRLRLPGGCLSPHQWLAVDEMADRLGNGTLKLTTRQSIQLHGVIKTDLKKTMQELHERSLTCIAASGDAVRNVMAATNPDAPELSREIMEQARNLSRKLEPHTHAYHEIWLDRKRVYTGGDEEPLYGAGYLPRKFKIAFALPPVNDVDVYAQDLAFVAIEDKGSIVGYDILAGGGQGYAYGNAASYPRLADTIGFCTPPQTEEVARQVLLIHKEYSTRRNRKISRLRYTMAERGAEWFIRELKNRLTFPLGAARPFTLASNSEAPDSPTRLTIFVDGGRVRDTEGQRMKTGLRELAKVHRGNFFITGNQNLTLQGIAPETLSPIKEITAAYDLLPASSGLRRHSSACTSLPWCPQALADSERSLPGLVTELEKHLLVLGLQDEPITLRMTGCPNGCTRPFLAEIAFVGRAPGKYNIWIGGSRAGDRLAFIYRETVPASELVEAVKPLFTRFSQERLPGESFGDWARRTFLSKG